MKTVLLLDPIAAEGEKVLSQSFRVLKAPDSAPATIRRLAKDADGIIIRSKLPDDVFDAAPQLKAVAIHGTGTDLVPLENANKHGVMVSNLPGINAQSVAEYCVMAMLMLARNIQWITSAIRSKPWDEARKGAAPAQELEGTTVGIVGVGEIGMRVAKICHAGFDMPVLGSQRRLDRLPSYVKGVAFETLMAESDFVVIACPLTKETHHLVNARTLALMKKTAWLVNVGRGPVIDEKALVAFLREKKIAGAMLDVYEHYRLEPGHELFSLDNVILTPHLAGGTIASRARASVAAAAEMQRMLAGQKPHNFVNPEVWEKVSAAA